MNYILFDDHQRDNLLPLTFTRPVCELRSGIFTIREKWEQQLHTQTSTHTQDYLQHKYPLKTSQQNLLINGGILPDNFLIKSINALETGTCLSSGNTIIAVHTDSEAPKNFEPDYLKSKYKVITYDSEIKKISYPYDIFTLAEYGILQDIKLLTSRSKNTPSSTNTLIGKHAVIMEDGAKAECSIFNTENGPVYLGKNSEVMEGSIIRGPFVLGEESVVKLGAKIYGPTIIGPHSKVGGEINNSVIQGYSNKAHDGFLGNSVIGEWCNLGADTNTSNLKNNYAPVKVWNYSKSSFVNSGKTFCGLTMGDHSKCGINTMFNTGTVVGVSANVFGSGFPRNFIPSYAWGGASGFSTFQFAKAMEVAEIVFKRRNIELSDIDKDILQTVFERTAAYRIWEKKI